MSQQVRVTGLPYCGGCGLGQMPCECPLGEGFRTFVERDDTKGIERLRRRLGLASCEVCHGHRQGGDYCDGCRPDEEEASHE